MLDLDFDFLTKSSITRQNFDFLTKSSITRQNFDFSQIFDFWSTKKKY